MRPDDRERAPGVHLDEGEAHAFVDGALGDAAAARVIAHVAGCAACAGVVAEARGLAAAATRILGALDEVPGGVVPEVVPAVVGSSPAPPTQPTMVRPGAAAAPRASVGGRRPRRWTAWPVRAAAGLLLAAGVGSAAWRATRDRPGVPAGVADTAVPAAASARVGTPTVAPVSEVASAASAAAAGRPPGAAAAEPRRAAAAPARAARPAAPAAAAARAAKAGAVALAPPPPTGAAPPPPPAPVAALEASAAPGGAAVGATVHKQTGPARDVAAAPDAGGRGMSAAGRAAAADVAVAAPAAPAPAGDQLARRAPAPYSSARAEALGSGAGAVTGVVLDPAGRPVAAAQVEADSGAARTTTGSDGRFVLGELAAGETTLRVRRIGFELARATVQVAARDTVRAEVRLKAATTALSQVVVTGAAVALPVAGCYAVRATDAGVGAALSDRVLLRADAAGPRSAGRRRTRPEPGTSTAPAAAVGTLTDAGGLPRGRWALRGDTLVLRWADAAAVVLRATPNDGWGADGLALERVGAPGGGCPPR